MIAFTQAEAAMYLHPGGSDVHIAQGSERGEYIAKISRLV